jgi:hypothetical protein
VGGKRSGELVAEQNTKEKKDMEVFFATTESVHVLSSL